MSKSIFTNDLIGPKKSNVCKHLQEVINNGLIPYTENGPVMTLRRQIQDDPMVERELALRLKELSKVYNAYCDHHLFKF